MCSRSLLACRHTDARASSGGNSQAPDQMIRMPSSVSLQPLLDAIILNRHSAIRIPARHADRLDNFCLRHRDRPGIQGRLRRRRGSVRRQWRRRLKPAVNYNVTIVTCCLAAYPSPLSNHAFSNRQLSPTSTRNRAPADVTIQQSLPHQSRFFPSALSEGLFPIATASYRIRCNSQKTNNRHTH